MSHGQPRDLAEMQRWLRWVFTDSRGAKKALQGYSSGLTPEPQPRRLESIESSGAMSRERRLQVYADSYFGRLHDSLADDFDTVFRALGPDRFRAAIRDFLHVNPSHTTTVSDVGRSLEAFFREQYRGAQPKYTADLAALDWAVNAAFFADDLPLLDTSSLSGVAPESWPQARFTLDASVFLVRSAWSIDEPWEHKDWDARRIAREIRAEDRCVLVYRKDEEVWIEAVDEIRGAMLQQMRDGRTLSELCAEIPVSVAATAEKVQQTFGESFGYWVAEGILRRIDFSN
jgi:hypothetical protein